MSKEKNIEEDIERCKRIIKNNNKIVKEARKNNDINTMQLTADLDNDSIAIEIVLNLIQEDESEKKRLQDEIEKKDIQISRLSSLSYKLNEEIDKLKLIAGLALRGRPLEISKKTFKELNSTIEIEQMENIENNSFIFRTR